MATGTGTRKGAASASKAYARTQRLVGAIERASGARFVGYWNSNDA